MNSRHHWFSFFTLFSFLFATLRAIPPTLAAPQSRQTLATAATSDLQALAERGDSGAQFRLAKALLAHNPSPDDVQTALKWLRVSVAQNNPGAAFYLGYFYEHGKFVAQDYGLAFQNYEIATRVHYPAAENNLASLYEHGQGVPQNIGKAYEWYLAAAQHGDPVGQINLATFYYLGIATPRDYKEAVRWLRLSADSRLPEAENCLAYFYFYGVTVPRDYTEAARLVRLAALAGFPGAETNLGYLYETGKGVPLDYVASYAWYSRAIAAGDSAGTGQRKQLARIMTRKQLDEASALVTTASATPTPPVPAPPPILQPAIPAINGFSLLNTQH
jgi:TPR repeat protein